MNVDVCPICLNEMLSINPGWIRILECPKRHYREVHCSENSVQVTVGDQIFELRGDGCWDNPTMKEAVRKLQNG